MVCTLYIHVHGHHYQIITSWITAPANQPRSLHPCTCTCTCSHRDIGKDTNVYTWIIHTKNSSKCNETLLLYIHSVCTKESGFPYILNWTGSPCLLGCHDYIAACAGARAQNVCVLNIPCLRPHAIQYLLYYCAFIWGTINICVWVRAAKGHLAKRLCR